MRGFVLGGNDAFLDPYHAGVADARRALVQLDALARDEDARRARSRPGRGAARHRRLGDRLRAADDGAHPPARRRRASRPPPSRTARRASTPCAPRSRGCAATCRPSASMRAASSASAANTLTRSLVFAAVLLLVALLAIAVIGRQVIERADRAAGHAGARRRRRGAAARDPRPAARATSSGSGATWSRCASGSCAELEVVRARRGGDPGQGARAGALERRARAVRLRRLARPPGAAAQGHELLPDARAPLRGTARRARRAVHRLRRRRRQAHAGAHQRSARLLARRAHRAPARARRHGRARRAAPRARWRSPSRSRAPPSRSTGACPRSTGSGRCSGSCCRT